MPSKYYRRDFVTDSAVTCVWFLDTQMLRRGDDEQVAWLGWTLEQAASNCDWKIVTGHHPIFDSDHYRHRDDPQLIKHVLPLLERHGVDLYLSGHVHQSRVLRKERPTKALTFIIAGASAEVSCKERSHEMLVWVNRETATFLHLSIDRAAITYSFIESETSETLFTDKIAASLK